MVNTLSKHAKIEARDFSLWNQLASFGVDTSSGYARASRQQIADVRSALTAIDKRAISANRAEILEVASGKRKSETSDNVNALLARCENYGAKISRVKIAAMLPVIHAAKQSKRTRKSAS